MTDMQPPGTTPDPAGKKATKPKGEKRPPRPTVKIMPIAPRAKLHNRHYRLMFSFGVLVLLPLAAVIFYLWFFAKDQYASTTGFTVRREEGGTSADILGNLSQITGGSGAASDSDILYEFIQSQEMVLAIDAEHDLRAIYSQYRDEDPLFSIAPDAPIEKLLAHWQRMVQISYDQSAGLIELRVLAFDPETAQDIGLSIVSESQRMINDLNATSRADTMRYANSDLADATARLRLAREQMTQFRTRTQIVDPNADLQSQMGVINNLQQQLAEALIDYDETVESVTADPRLPSLRRRIDIIRSRIGQERQGFANDDVPGVNADYPTLMSEYEGLLADREYAEEAYRAARAAVDTARSQSLRQTRYLATYIPVSLPQSPEYPQRFLLSGLAGLFLLLAWSVMALVYYSLRDRR
ncbi:sugar transporter [Loktanella sp. R86503]|uniref:sugar transporter n=1 Tax=Loktanella sp. R86503 TaxID=3093847 RepID=UPI0036D965C1